MKQLKNRHFWIWLWVTAYLIAVIVGLSVHVVRTEIEKGRLSDEVAETSGKLERLSVSIKKLSDASIRVRTLIEFHTKQERLMLEWNEWMAPALENTLEIVVDKDKEK